MTTTAYYQKNKERLKAYQKKYRASKQYKAYQLKYNSIYWKRYKRDYNDKYIEAHLRWQQDHPDGIKAHQAVIRAIKAGKLIKSLSCQKCFRVARLSAHHKDYSKPLEVLWLCHSCHRFEHI